MRFTFVFIVTMLSLLTMSCNNTSPNTGSAELIVNMIVTDGESIISENVFLRNNADATKVFKSVIQNNQVVFTGLDFGEYSFYLSSQLYDENIIVSTENVFRNLQFNSEIHETRILTLRSHTFREIAVIYVSNSTFDDINSLSHIVLSPGLSFGDYHNLVILDDYLIKRARIKGHGGIYSISNLDKTDEVYITNYDRPWASITFCEKTLDSNLNGFSIFYDDNGIVQTGIKSFDQIAREYMIIDLINSMINNKYPEVYSYLVVSKPIEGIYEALLNEVSIQIIDLIHYMD